MFRLRDRTNCVLLRGPAVFRGKNHQIYESSSSLSKKKESKNKDIAVYVHWPFCKKLCTFCNFNKYVRDNVDHDRMAACLEQEMETLLSLTGASNVKSVYFGGGTPSLAKPSTIKAVIECIRKVCQIQENCEVTLEANPSSSLPLSDFKSSGITRLSLGIQSLIANDLEILGRDHTVYEAIRSLEKAKSLFPGKVSVDMMFGRPNQTPESWKKELNQILSLCDNHLSLYQLTVERGTQLYKDVKKGNTVLPDEDVMADLYQLSVEIAESKGYERYEVSSFAKPGSESQHNLSYWDGSPYIGIGPGAHSRYYLQEREINREERFACVQTLEPNSWMTEVEKFGHATRYSAKQSTIEILQEILSSGLRTRLGLTNQVWDAFSPETMSDLSQTFSTCKDAANYIEAGLLIVDNNGIRATKEGLNVVDSMITTLAIHLENIITPQLCEHNDRF